MPVAGALGCPANLVCLVGTSDPWLTVGLAAPAGASLPATTSGMRLLWPGLVADPRRWGAAYALLATQFQVAPGVGAAVATAASARIAVRRTALTGYRPAEVD